ncbi:TetR/AcrR family transcriptional regulator [Actinosynnema sp.]|uniref:TetR/AcrR family transcriptional regulator n=1 Tax=Actinosynnema sp. TaxID=1872144 RepID=UPI003F83B68D
MADESARTRQGLRTRGALLRAGRQVLEQRGYHQTRIADITQQASTSVGTFYLHFKDKDELFRQLLIDVEDEVYGELSPRRTDTVDPAQRIEETNRLYLQAFQRNAQFWRVIEEASLSDPESRRVLDERLRLYRSRTERAIVRWQAGGFVDADLDPTLAAALLGSMTERCAYHWFVFGEAPDLDTVSEHLTTLWLNLLGLSRSQ